MSDVIHIQGYRAKVISRNYQTGEVSFEFDDAVPQGYTVFNTMTFEEFNKIHTPDLSSGYWGNLEVNTGPKIKCTCGNNSVAPNNQGKHSTWCDLYNKWSES